MQFEVWIAPVHDIANEFPRSTVSKEPTANVLCILDVARNIASRVEFSALNSRRHRSNLAKVVKSSKVHLMEKILNITDVFFQTLQMMSTDILMNWIQFPTQRCCLVS
jgi:hypothetical protein